jgi:hypothetical protein
VRIEESPENIVALSAIRREKQRALSPYGPVKAGLTTLPSPKINTEEYEVRLSELLSSLESAVETLQFKSFTAYDMLNVAIEDLRVALSTGITDTTGIEDSVL